MATVAITSEQDTIVAEIQIAAPPERVFSAITDPVQLLQWWGQEGMYRGTKWDVDLRPGGKYRSEGVSQRDGSAFLVHGEYLEVDPPRLLVYTWNPSWQKDLATTTVRWELKPQSGGTLVTLRHSGFGKNVQAAKNHSQGWALVLGWMQAFLEKNITVDTRKTA